MDKNYCDTRSKCWADGICDSFLNNEKHCFDGGDCEYKYKTNNVDTCCTKDFGYNFRKIFPNEYECPLNGTENSTPRNAADQRYFMEFFILLPLFIQILI